MNARGWLLLTILGLVSLAIVACERGAGGGDEDGEEAGNGQVEINEDLGTLRVLNGVDEPVSVYLDGQELYAVPPGRAYTFRNLPTGEVSIYGVGRISQKHFGLPELTIEEGGEYEWTIEP